MSSRPFLSLDDLGAAGIEALIEQAIERKRAAPRDRPLAGRSLAMVFEKASTRTRVSFEAAMTRLGGHAIFLTPYDTQIGRGEPVADTARILSGMCDGIMIRNHSHPVLEQFAASATVPVINGLSDRLHPCQLLADLQTYTEHRGSIRGATVAWVGDGNNMCQSWINAARLMGFALHIAVPEGYRPELSILQAAGAAARVHDRAHEAVAGADLVVTDVWASMGDEANRETRLADFAPYQVNRALMRHAADNALFMHCLPAHRGEEVSAEVIDGPGSVVWEEAENRLHAQVALLLELLGET